MTVASLCLVKKITGSLETGGYLFFIIHVIEITRENGYDQHSDHEKIIPCDIFHTLTSLRVSTKEGERYFGFLDETPSKQPPLTKSDMTEADTPLREPQDSALNYSTNAFQNQGFFICLTTKKSCFFLFRITKNS